MQANTNNINKISALLQTIGGKDEPNINFRFREKNKKQKTLLEKNTLIIIPPLI
jgi:hypothetical protein